MGVDGGVDGDLGVTAGVSIAVSWLGSPADGWVAAGSEPTAAAPVVEVRCDTRKRRWALWLSASPDRRAAECSLPTASLLVWRAPCTVRVSAGQVSANTPAPSSMSASAKEPRKSGLESLKVVIGLNM